MKLSALIGHPVAEDFTVTAMVDDSRRVTPGAVFVFDSRIVTGTEKFVAQALEAGARAVVVDPAGEALLEEALRLRVLVHPMPGQLLAHWAAAQSPGQPAHMVAVTGTNGKTSVAWFYRQLAQHCGHKAASLGTLGAYVGDTRASETGYTTPTALQLHPLLADWAAAGVTHAALEASSHALALGRLDGTRFEAVGFTNLSPDHRDFHGSMEAYFQAKFRLFAELLKDGGTAVINVSRLKELPPQAVSLLLSAPKLQGNHLLTVGAANAELIVKPVEASGAGLTLHIRFAAIDTHVTVPLIGRFQAENVAVALGLAMASGMPLADLIQHLPQLSCVPGRMELLTTPEHAQVVIDYAHTPDALATALQAARPHTAGKLWVVFGCGGNRDTAKRAQMGEIAARLADVVVVTDDNPRREDPAAIRAEIISAAPRAHNIADRATAIEYALQHAGPDDLVLVAGKGHESTQIVGTEVLPYSDYTTVSTLLAQPGH